MERYDWLGQFVRIVLGAAVMTALALALSALPSCSSTKHIEQVRYRDSIITHHVTDTTFVTIQDTLTVEQHSTSVDSSSLHIVFASGGGTYNTRTGEATNVAGVKENKHHEEQRDSIAKLRLQIDYYQARSDSLARVVSEYESELVYEKAAPKRSGYDRFCSWWFWITAILLLLKLAAWIMEKFPATSPYIITIRRFVPFL
jgi:hypothetical protein